LSGLLYQLSYLRAFGIGAGETVVGLLQHDDWKVRVTAARTLGWIGYDGGVDALRTRLESAEDWRLAYASAESLGRMKAGPAKRALEAAAEKYWYPPVRQAAKEALDVVEGLGPEPRPEVRDAIRWSFLEYLVKAEEFSAREKLELEVATVSEANVLTKNQLEQESYTVESYGEVGVGCGLRIEKGLMLGSDRGEWGGELVFTDLSGSDHILVRDNVVGIHRMPFGVVAATGLAHMDTNRGYLYLIDVDAEPIPTARIWKALPGAPRKTGRLVNGGLFISCVGGDVVISPEGKIAMATEVTVGLK
jgi:hypothetical protein